ncbi:MAG: hypothetical protein R3F34_19290 [Planctomycetota bacterium]
MSMQARIFLYIAALWGGAIALSFACPEPYDYLAPVIWCAVFIVGQFFAFRCPHCRKMTTSRGWTHTPFVGRTCYHCGGTI